MSSVVPHKVFSENPTLLTSFDSIKQSYIQRPKKIPLKVIFTEDQETSSSERFSQSTEDMFHLVNNSATERSYYPFSILKSRKKEKKYLRKKFNTVISRVHNMDCLLKKIKA